jgi:predicted DCC family thiol-disulfide oxidoreductase YuxK
LTSPAERADPASTEEVAADRIVFFDGACNFCNALVDFLIRRDRGRRLRYASLQSPFAARFLGDRGLHIDPERLDRLVYFADGRLYSGSDAALRIPRALPAAWPLLGTLLWVPAPLRDRVYDLVARHRQRLLGRRNECRVPTPAERALFLDGRATGRR